MDRLTEKHWRNLDPWECCGQDNFCQRGCHEEGGCTGGCIVPKNYTALAKYEDTELTPKEIADLRAQLALTDKALGLLLDNLFEMDDETCPADTVDSGFDCDINICGIERPYKKCWKQYYLQQAKAGDSQ